MSKHDELYAKKFQPRHPFEEAVSILTNQLSSWGCLTGRVDDALLGPGKDEARKREKDVWESINFLKAGMKVNKKDAEESLETLQRETSLPEVMYVCGLDEAYALLSALPDKEN